MDKLRAYFELTKPRLAALILIVAVASFYLASPAAVNFGRMAVAAAGIGLLAAGVLSLNSWIERDTDLLMRRTQGRPLPSGRLSSREGLVFGAAATAVSIAVIALVFGWVACAVAVFTFVSYDLVYTPLKRRTTLHTAIGALSGATPPLLGWAAARGSLDLNAWILGGILFLWQYPHFLAIDTMYTEDYGRAGIKVLPGARPHGERDTGWVVMVTLSLLLVTSTGLYFTGMAGIAYLVGALVLGAGFFAVGLVLSIRRTKVAARMVLRASVSYLPVVFVLMVATVRTGA
jgi:heme o synthase